NPGDADFVTTFTQYANIQSCGNPLIQANADGTVMPIIVSAEPQFKFARALTNVVVEWYPSLNGIHDDSVTVIGTMVGTSKTYASVAAGAIATVTGPTLNPGHYWVRVIADDPCSPSGRITEDSEIFLMPCNGRCV